MIKSGLIWRMAFGHLKKQWKQTLLTVIAGAIGAMLISISVVNYESVKHSGAAWIEKRLGPINWKLTPENLNSGGFSAEETALLMDYPSSMNNDYTLLPYVKTEANLISNTAGDRNQAALTNMLLLGFSLETAAKFDPKGAELWNRGLADDELIINRETAGLLQVQIGDTVTIKTADGQKLLRIRDVAEQRGLTGYIDSGAFTGTVIGSERTVRELSHQEGDSYEAILVGSKDPSTELYGMFRLQELPFQVVYLKQDAMNKVRQMNYALIIGMISLVAIASSMLFMRQVLVMIGESRQEMYGILRAIGFSRGHISAMFLVEAFLLSLLSALLGTVVGVAGGYGFVELLYNSYTEELSRMAGNPVTIQPYVSAFSIIFLFVIVLLFLAVISLFVARQTSRFQIVEALRGSSDDGGAGQGGKKKPWTIRLLLTAGLAAACIHFVFVFIEPPELNGDNMLLIASTWLITCFTVLFFALNLLGRIDLPLQKLLRFIRLPAISVMLAVKYSRRHIGRTYTAALLFALVMMVITFMTCIMQLLLAAGSVERTDQTVIGFGGYAAYQSVQEKEKLITAATADTYIKHNIKGVMTVEPFMLQVRENGRIAQAALPVTEEIVKHGGLELLARSPEFSSDQETWQAVLDDPTYIILPHFYMMEDPLFPDAIELMKAGDHITLPIYKGGTLVYMGEGTTPALPVSEQTFIIAGFVPNQKVLIDFYGGMFMNKSVVEELRPYGFKWPNQTSLGFALFRFDYRDIKLAQALEERFAILGVLDFNVPYLKNTASQLMNKQIGNGFIGFTVISACICLMGLAIIQFRAVRERSKQVAMMRCIGLPGRHIYWMFFIEGFVISAIGLLVGWGVGSSGASIFVEGIKKDTRVYEDSVIFNYPFEILVPLIGGLLIASLLINIAPSRAALKLKAADALRMSND
ncbi:ABC-type lipoprotein release transport system permease subunit [Paenibacillus castaneae]|uniref:ABC transporter permease n=1 Tax=Paenibacillus castaneae TaxID=474957 RepID=UPI000C9A01EC|nr:FtsX-like permease family protein [Paenibacillus castaneae]NIK77889.1 ABC-type lipoprotein release transport system permease subunit [Paenibacillus castaneae]